MSRPYKQVDVFTNKRFKGNPLAVFFDSDHLTDQEMQTIANWTNLSETTFVTRPTDPKADYNVRIFTTVKELPFAGHPTIGTCYALLELKQIKPTDGKIYQQCLGGLVELTINHYNADNISDVYISFQLPYYKISPFSVTEEVMESMFNIESQTIISKPILVEDGPKWAVFELDSGETVRDCKPNFNTIKIICTENNWDGIGIFGKYTNGEYELRNFAPFLDCDEDPACGSGAGAIGVYLTYYLKQDIHNLVLNQGHNLGREATLNVTILKQEKSDPIITVGGQAITIINGTY